MSAVDCWVVLVEVYLSENADVALSDVDDSVWVGVQLLCSFSGDFRAVVSVYWIDSGYYFLVFACSIADSFD